MKPKEWSYSRDLINIVGMQRSSHSKRRPINSPAAKIEQVEEQKKDESEENWHRKNESLIDLQLSWNRWRFWWWRAAARCIVRHNQLFPIRPKNPTNSPHGYAYKSTEKMEISSKIEAFKYLEETQMRKWSF